MQIPKYFEIVSLVFLLLSRGCDPESKSQGNDSIILNTNEVQVNNHLEKSEEGSTEDHKTLCPICIEELPPFTESEEIFCFKNGYFRCPYDKYFYHLKCITTWLYPEDFDINSSGNCKTCPNCTNVLKDSILKFKNNFIEYFLMNPHEDLLKTFELVLIRYDPKSIIESFFPRKKISKDSLELLMKLTDPITDRNVLIFKRIIVWELFYFKIGNVSSEIFENFCSEILSNPDNVLEILSKNLECIKLFSAYQRSEMFDLLLGIDISDKKIKSDAIFFLYDRFSDSRLFWILIEDIRIELMIFLLKEKTIKGLKLFTILNFKSFFTTKDVEEKIAKLLYSLFTEFGFHEIYFHAIKDFNKTSPLSSLKSYLLSEYAPLDMILECDYEFLKKYLEKDLIFEVFMDYFKDENTVEKAMNYYFRNVIQEISHNPFSLIDTFLCFLNFTDDDGLFSRNLKLMKAFLTAANRFDDSKVHLTKAYEFYRKKESFEVLGIFINLCFKLKIEGSLLKPFIPMLKYDLFSIVIYPPFSEEKINYVFGFLKDLEEKKPNYEGLNLSDTLY